MGLHDLPPRHVLEIADDEEADLGVASEIGRQAVHLHSWPGAHRFRVADERV
jgi:hypothetical protein